MRGAAPQFMIRLSNDACVLTAANTHCAAGGSPWWVGPAARVRQRKGLSGRGGVWSGPESERAGEDLHGEHCRQMGDYRFTASNTDRAGHLDAVKSAMFEDIDNMISQIPPLVKEAEEGH